MIPVASTFIYAMLIAPAFDDVSIGYRPTYVFSSLSGAMNFLRRLLRSIAPQEIGIITLEFAHICWLYTYRIIYTV